MFNRFVPAGLRTKGAYGWSGVRYDIRDVPGWTEAGPRRKEFMEQQFSYEWFDWNNPYNKRSNPPFLSGAAGVLLPSLTVGGVPGGQPARVLRGFIRRAEYEPGNKASFSRLYFMYNPEVIVRDYVSYLDQGALDPFNSVFDSGNLVAPPSFLDFTFQLFFDRMVEAQHPQNPGCFVDYEYFDLVVRNVVPRNPRTSNNTLPDSGVMMVNPRDITVVFSPQITVQGRPLNARVTFEKFTHRMVPTRMRIDLTVRVIYFGPMREMVEHKQEEFAVAQTIPWHEIKPHHFEFTYDQLIVMPTLPPGAQQDLEEQKKLTDEANKQVRENAVEKAEDKGGDTKWSMDDKLKPWAYASPASFVLKAYDDIGHMRDMGWDKTMTPTKMLEVMKGRNRSEILWEGKGTKANLEKMKKGDLLFGKQPYDNVAFVYSQGGGKIGLYYMSQLLHRSYHENWEINDDNREFLEKFHTGTRPAAIAQVFAANPGSSPAPPVGGDVAARVLAIANREQDPYLYWIDREPYKLVSGSGTRNDAMEGGVTLPGTVHPSPDDPLNGSFFQLHKDAADSLLSVVAQVGPLPIWDCRRTWRFQEANSGTLIGNAGGGESEHVVGLAMDVRTDAPNFNEVIAAIEAAGWYRYDPVGDVGHLSYLDSERQG